MTEKTAQLQVGDTVKLKSGGPAMTVDRLMGEGADCLWFDGIRPVPVMRWFAFDVLARVDNPEASQ